MAHRHNDRAWRTGVALLIAVTLLAAGIAAAKDPEARAQAIAAQLRCPVCQNESVADSPSELAAQMRTLIRAKVAAGETDQQIVDYFVSKYGEWILLEPPRRGPLWIVWLAPAVALLGGAYLAFAYLRRSMVGREVGTLKRRNVGTNLPQEIPVSLCRFNVSTLQRFNGSRQASGR